MSKYNCPKCHCGCMFEEKNKLICMNCDAEVPAFAARGVRHVHHYQTYTSGKGDTPVRVARPAPQPVRTVGQSRPVTPSTFPRNIRGTVSKPEDPRKKKKGCGFWILLYFGLFWLLPLLAELFS